MHAPLTYSFVEPGLGFAELTDKHILETAKKLA
jgi:hypothetical protein